MAIFNDIAQSIGDTPLIRLNKVVNKKAIVYAKIEARNPAYSVKCRLGAAMIWDAEKKGLILPGAHIVEPSSGNTGIALAAICASRGYKLTITMPETMSIERRKVMAMFGAKIVLTPGAEGMSGAIKKAYEIMSENHGCYMPLQFENPVGPQIHFETTGPEIWHDLESNVDVLVSGVGTGGTLTGATKYLKSRNPGLQSVAVEPADSPVITQKLAGLPLKPGPHKIQGIGAGFIPSILDLNLIDLVETVSNEEAIDYARRLAREEGLLVGISSGAAVAAAARLSNLEPYHNKTIVVILPDAGERYMSSALFDDVA